jgi:hypothetical protein
MGRLGLAEAGHGRVQPAIQLHYSGKRTDFSPFFPRIRGNSGLVSLSPWVQRVEPGHPCPADRHARPASRRPSHADVIGPANFRLVMFKLKADAFERAALQAGGRRGADMKLFHRSILTRTLMAGAAFAAAMMAAAGVVRAQTVVGGGGTPGAICQDDDWDCDINGGDGDSVSAGGNPAVAIGGGGGAAGSGGYGNGDGTGNGGNGGSATAVATGGSVVSASATGGAGGVGYPSYGGSGGNASATSTAKGGSGGASSSAVATGGLGQIGLATGGSATATASAWATRGGLAVAEAVATGGEHLNAGPGGAYPAPANATSSAKSSFAGAGVRSTDEAAVNMMTYGNTGTVYGNVATANAVAQAGGSGQTFLTPIGSAYAFSTVLPDKAEVATLIGGASTVANAFLGQKDTVFGTSTLGINYYPDGPVETFIYSESSTFDFTYRGDLLLGLIDGGGDFSVIINGVQVLADSFTGDTVINLGFDFGSNIDLEIVLDGVGDFVLGGAVPEPSTWAMMLVGFAGLGFMGWRRRAARVV